MNTLVIDPDALRRAQHRLHEANQHLRRLRATPVRYAVVGEIARAEGMVHELSRRIAGILSSPLLLDPPRRTAVLTSTIDDWIADRKWWARSTTRDSTPIDPVVSMMAADMSTRDALIDSIMADGTHRLSALLFGATDIAKVRDLCLRATDPRSVNPDVARTRIEAVAAAVFAEPGERATISGARLDVAALERRRDDLRELLGMMAAPWVLHFTGLASRWGGNPESGRDLLHRIADHDAAAVRVRDGLVPAIEDAFRDMPSGHDERMTRIDEIAFAVGASTEILRRVDVDAAHRAASTRSALLSIPGHLPLGLSWPAGLALGAATSVVAGRLDSRHDVEERSARTEHDDRERLARVAENSARRAAVEDGLMNADATHVPADVRVQIQHAADAVSNAADRGDEFAAR
ncbi:MAG: hypothetical protein LW627_05300 [Ilumatobacteraceae bacterium]|jgi:hypothetical protein|nr:hypothetical protein [Ilumatobacteraceae bacterium]